MIKKATLPSAVAAALLIMQGQSALAQGAGELEERLREVFSLRIPVEQVSEGSLERSEMKSRR